MLLRVIVPLLVLSANDGLCAAVFVEPQLLSKCSLILLSSTFCSHIGLYSRFEISHYWMRGQSKNKLRRTR